MQQTAAAVPLQPHVDRAAFSEACATYEPPQKQVGAAVDHDGREKKEAQVSERGGASGRGTAGCMVGLRFASSCSVVRTTLSIEGLLLVIKI